MLELELHYTWPAHSSQHHATIIFISLSICYHKFLSYVVLCLQKSLLPTPKCGLPFMSILLHTCAGPDIDQLILLRMLSSTMYSRNWNILLTVSLAFAHSKTGKLSLRLLDRAVSTEILVQNLTTPGTESHARSLQAWRCTSRLRSILQYRPGLFWESSYRWWSW